jgi:hypothetical protein
VVEEGMREKEVASSNLNIHKTCKFDLKFKIIVKINRALGMVMGSGLIVKINRALGMVMGSGWRVVHII